MAVARRRRLVLIGPAVALALLVVAAALFLRRDDSPPDAFTNRSPLPSCGTVTAGAGSQCLTAAMGTGAGAELTVTSVTTEGDPIVAYYRAVPGQPGLEVFTDSTKDKFSGTGWSYARCPQASGIDSLGSCSEKNL